MTNVSIKWLSEVCSLQREVRGHSLVLTQRCHSLSVTKQENKKARFFYPKTAVSEDLPHHRWFTFLLPQIVATQ